MLNTVAPCQFLSSHNPRKVDHTTGVRPLFAVVSSMMVREQLRAKFCGGRINWFVLIRTSPVHVQHILRKKVKGFHKQVSSVAGLNMVSSGGTFEFAV